MTREVRRAQRLAAAVAAALAVAASALPGAPDPADGKRTAPAAGSTGCTTQNSNIVAAADQKAQPWEIAAAGLQLTSGLTGKGVKVAVIDTGVNKNDPQLGPAVLSGADFTGSGTYGVDADGHGTMVASIIAAHSSSRNGMTGIAPQVSLLIYREAGCNVPAGNNEGAMADAINAAVAAGARVINISQDGYTPDPRLKAAVANAYQNNVVIVTSAGNYGDKAPTEGNVNYGVDPTMYPAAYAPLLLAVGAADQDAAVPSFSETGRYVGVTAPGKAVGALFPDGRIMIDDGTSFASPYVAAVAALLLEKHPGWTAGTVIKVLEATASGNHKWTGAGGWGEVSVEAALNADPARLPGLFGAGPNADGPATAAPVHRGVTMLPVVSPATPAVVVDQQKGAYAALACAALVVMLALGGTIVIRDARRRRAA